jgi:hypothetical protein
VTSAIDAPSAALASAGGEFRVGRVFGQAARVFVRNLPKLLVLAAISHVASTALQLTGIYRLFGPPTLWIMYVWLIPTLLTALVFRPFSEAAVVHAGLQFWDRGRVRLGTALARAVARFIPSVAVTVLVRVVIFTGYFAPGLASVLTSQRLLAPNLALAVLFLGLLVLPGAWLALIWSVALPACVVEGRGPFASLRRSAQLTKGHRAKVFGILLLLAPVSLVLGPLMRGLWMGAIAVRFQPLSPLTVIQGISWGLLAVNIVWEAFAACVLAAIFHQLRAAREGIDVERVTAVFD